MLSLRIRKRFRRECLRLVGEPVRNLVAVTAQNANQVAESYPRVTANALVESAGWSTLVPKHLPEDSIETLRPFKIECENVLLDVCTEGFLFANDLFFDPARNAIFADTFPVGQLLAYRRHIPRHFRTLNGTVAYLSYNWVENYYHWMQLALPLLRTYATLAPNIHIDYFYVGEFGAVGVQDETLEWCGISREQLVREPCTGSRVLMAIQLHRPQFGGMRYRDMWGHQFVRSIYGPLPRVSSPERIYVRRGNTRTRRMTNEAQLLEFLEAFGFVSVTMDGVPVAEQANLFGNARVIIATHGAALTNLIFAQAGTKVIELFPPGVHETSFFTAATHSQLEYYYVVGQCITPTPHFQFSISLEKMAALLLMADIHAHR